MSSCAYCGHPPHCQRSDCLYEGCEYQDPDSMQKKYVDWSQLRRNKGVYYHYGTRVYKMDEADYYTVDENVYAERDVVDYQLQNVKSHTTGTVGGKYTQLTTSTLQQVPITRRESYVSGSQSVKKFAVYLHKRTCRCETCGCSWCADRREKNEKERLLRAQDKGCCAIL